MGEGRCGEGRKGEGGTGRWETIFVKICVYFVTIRGQLYP